MRILPFLLFLFASNINAKEVKTDSFTLNLPDNYHVETDKRRRLLAFGGNGPDDLPFLIIEFGKKVKLSSAIERVNDSIKQFNKSLKEEECSPDCRAFYVELSITEKDVEVYLYYYIVESEKLNFMISFGDKDDIENGRVFVKSLASQIIKNDI